MKTNKNNIDELFRAGLGNFAEQPSRSLWRRISWQMLRTEVKHFNFSNVPASWVAVPVAAIIIASVAIYNFNTSPATEELSKADQTQPFVDDKSPTGSPSDLYEIDNKLAKPSSNTEDSRLSDQLQPGTNEKTQTPLADRINENVVIQPEIAGADATAGAETPIRSNITVENSDFKDKQSSVETINEVFAPIQKTDPMQAVTAPVIAVTAPGINDEIEVNADKSADLTHSAVVKSEMPSPESYSGGISKLDKLRLKNIEPMSMEERATMNDGYYRYFTRVTGLEAKSNQKDADELSHTTGKPISLSSTNHAFANLFRGPYKPPKREFKTLAIKNQKRKTSLITLALYAAPEITEYARMASTSREKSFAGGLAVGYTTPKYIIQGGLEFSYVYDLGDYMVNMATYDSIGFYEHINGFIIDPENPGNLIYDIQEVGVWDSIQHYSHQQTQNSYTYLQFPILLGYKAMEQGIFSAYIKAGPSFSILLNKNEPELAFYQPGATVNTVDNYTLPRLTANVQLLVSLGLQLQISEKMGILAEPFYRYYLGNVYQLNSSNEQLSNPYGIGIRAGVFYTF